MSIVTRRNLLAEKTGFAISVGGIALSVFLISFLMSNFQAWNLLVGRFVERVDADVWVVQEGTTSFFTAASILPGAMQEELAEIPGVAHVDSLIVRPMNVETDGGQANTHLVGYDVEGGAGGPLKITDGEELPGAGEVIVDDAFELRTGVGLGDVIQAAGQPFSVVGVSAGGDFIFSQTSFVSLEVARALLGMDGLSTFFLVRVADGTDVAEVTASIEERFPDVRAFTGIEFAEATRDQVLGDVVPILFLILGLAFAVGVAITGLTIYNATVEKAREYGILKAIGFPNGYLFRLVLEQSLVTGLLGFIIGVGLTLVAARFVTNLVPQFVTVIRWQEILIVLGATLLMSIIAAVVPVRRIANVDPVEVFNA